MLRRFLQLLPLALLAAAPITGRAGVVRSVGSAEVVAVQPTRIADLVLLGRGFDAGFRQGMVCRITRADATVAEVILVELRPTCAAALILDLAPRQSIRAGDLVRVKTLKL